MVPRHSFFRGLLFGNFVKQLLEAVKHNYWCQYPQHTALISYSLLARNTKLPLMNRVGNGIFPFMVNPVPTGKSGLSPLQTGTGRRYIDDFVIQMLQFSKMQLTI